MNTNNLDEKDLLILSSLQKNSVITNNDLAKKVGLSPSACLVRTKRLFNEGIIKQFTVVIDPLKIGYNILTLTFVTLHPHNRKMADNFVDKINKIPQIIECHNMTGSWDYCLKIVAKNIEDYRNFVLDTLLEIGGVEKIETQIVLKSDKNSLIPVTNFEIK
jgi:Lrp/AsnC family transcriptional regulator